MFKTIDKKISGSFRNKLFSLSKRCGSDETDNFWNILKVWD